jgi:hypothetical protein
MLQNYVAAKGVGVYIYQHAISKQSGGFCFLSMYGVHIVPVNARHEHKRPNLKPVLSPVRVSTDYTRFEVRRV